jgi:hypothetical protein
MVRATSFAMPVSPDQRSAHRDTSSSVLNRRFITDCAEHAAEPEAIVQPPSAPRSLTAAALAERGLEHLYELDELEWLDEEVDGASLERPYRVVDAAKPGRDHAPHVGIAGERFVQDVEAVPVGQLHIHYEGVVGKAVETRQRVGGVRGLGGGKAGGLLKESRSSGGVIHLRRRAAGRTDPTRCLLEAGAASHECRPGCRFGDTVDAGPA